MSWTDITEVSAGEMYVVGLKSNGTVVSTEHFGEYASGVCEGLDDWNDIVAVSAGGSVTAGIKSNGSVISTIYTGRFDDGQDDLSGWSGLKISDD